MKIQDGIGILGALYLTPGILLYAEFMSGALPAMLGVAGTAFLMLGVIAFVYILWRKDVESFLRAFNKITEKQ